MSLGTQLSKTHSEIFQNFAQSSYITNVFINLRYLFFGQSCPLMDICEEKAICSNFNTFIGSSNYGLLPKLDLVCGYWKFWNLEEMRMRKF